MSGNPSDNTLDHDLENLRRTTVCVRQMTRDFDKMTDRLRMENAELAALSEELRAQGGIITLTPAPVLAGAFEEAERSIARRKALRKELCQAAATYAQELINWAESLKKRQSQHNRTDTGHQVVGDPVNNLDPDRKGIESIGPTVGFLAKQTQEWATPTVKEVETLASEVGPDAELATEAIVSVPVAVLGLFFASGNSAGWEPDVSESNPQKGLILNPGERRAADGTIYTSDGRIAVYANGTSALSNEEREAISRGEGNQWTAPQGWRLPTSHGQWAGTPGNSVWQSNIPEINQVTGNRGIPFKHGYIDFSSFAVAQYNFNSLNGTVADFRLADQQLAVSLGFSSANAAALWRGRTQLSWHHVENGITLQLVPTVLNNIPHQGGASNLRDQQ